MCYNISNYTKRTITDKKTEQITCFTIYQITLREPLQIKKRNKLHELQ